MDEGSSKRKKRKRGRSLIFKSFFPHTTSEDDHGGKVLASDDNLVYCDVSNNGINGNPYPKTKPPQSRGRMSTLFKAVLFDSAIKKKMRGKRTLKSSTRSRKSAARLAEKTDKNDRNIVNVLETDNNSSTDSSNVDSSSPESDQASPAASSAVKTGSQMLSERKETSPVGSPVLTKRKEMSPVGSPVLAERKATTPVNSTDKKPPLPRLPVKPASERGSKPTALNNSMTSGLCLLIVLVVFVSVVLWISFTTSSVTESKNLVSDPYTNVGVVGDEL